MGFWVGIMNSTSPEKNSGRIRPEAYAAEMQASHDTELERALGKPRYSRDMEEENPGAEWLHRLDVGGIYDGFGFINHGDVARVRAGEMKREEMAAERVSAANSAETRIEKELERGSMEIADVDLERVSSQFKFIFSQKKNTPQKFLRGLQNALGMTLNCARWFRYSKRPWLRSQCATIRETRFLNLCSIPPRMTICEKP